MTLIEYRFNILKGVEICDGKLENYTHARIIDFQIKKNVNGIVGWKR